MTVPLYFDENVSGHIIVGLQRRDADLITTPADSAGGRDDDYRGEPARAKRPPQFIAADSGAGQLAHVGTHGWHL
jgi:hypothetical protein